jgi:LemA protein
MKKIFGFGCLAIVAVVVIGAVLVVAWGIDVNNSLVALSQENDKQWAQVQNVYQRRADLIPNLVATVSGAANFEKSTLVEVTEARASVGKLQINASSAPSDLKQIQEFEKAQGALSQAISRLLVVSERYPDLRATANFRDLQAQLEGTENRIAVERGRFNEAVQQYNTRVKVFPSCLIASWRNFAEKPYFTAQPGSDQAPKVQFDFNKK